MNKLLSIAILLLSFQLTAQSSQEPSAQSKLTPSKIMSVSQLEKFDPATQVSGLKGYNMRARKILVPAGVSIPEHGHTTRPGIVYVESGEIIEYRGDTSRLLKAGDSVVEDATTVHAYKNISDTDCVLIAFDLPKAE